MKPKKTLVSEMRQRAKSYEEYQKQLNEQLALIQQHNYQEAEKYILSGGQYRFELRSLTMSYTPPKGQKVTHVYKCDKMLDELNRLRFDQAVPYLVPPPSLEEKMAAQASELEAAYAWEEELGKMSPSQAPEEELPFYPLEHVYSDMNDLMIYSEPNLMTEDGIPANGRYQNGLITINKDLLNPERHAEAIGTLFEEYGEHQVEMGNKDVAQHIDKGALIGQQLLYSLINEASHSPEGHVTVPVTIDGQRHRLTATADQLKDVASKNFTSERINNPAQDEAGRYQYTLGPNSEAIFLARESFRNVHPIRKKTDKEILEHSVPGLATFKIDEAKRIISIHIKINYVPVLKEEEESKYLTEIASFFGLEPGKGLLVSPITSSQFSQYVNLANEGIKQYWSRQIVWGADRMDINQRRDNLWQVNVTASSGGKDTMYVAHPGTKNNRSVNPNPYGPGILYYISKRGNAEFKITAAHEIGHSILTRALGIKQSWGHDGSSSPLGEENPNALPYPQTGEINLMYYHQGKEPKDVYERTIASEDDVRSLLYIATQSK